MSNDNDDVKTIIKTHLGEAAVELFEKLLTQEPQHADAIVFLQGDRLDRAPKARSLHEQGFAEQILITGNNELAGRGKRSQENNVHLSKLKKYLVDRGVGEEVITVDERSMNTREQAANTIRRAKEKGWSRILVVTSPYHVLRAYLTFLKQIQEQDWEGEITMQTADLSWESVPGGREKTAREMLKEEMEKIKQYQADFAAREIIF